MKPNPGLNGKHHGRVVNGATEPTHQTDEPITPATTGDLERYRRLKWNELVRHGDFVANGGQILELWEGPNGFRADAYVKPIYRRQQRRPTGDKKLR